MTTSAAQRHLPQPMIRDTRTRVQEQFYRCIACRVRFSQQALVNVPIEFFAAQIKVLRCPRCGAGNKKIAMGEGRTRAEDAAERVDGNIDTRTRHWLTTGERGRSADTILNVMATGHPGNHAAHPVDTDDLRRCLLLLEHVPELEKHIGRMAAVSPEWKRIAAAWPEIAGAMRDEAPNYDQAAPRAAAALAKAISGDGTVTP